jgi:hypothetical protein
VDFAAAAEESRPGRTAPGVSASGNAARSTVHSFPFQKQNPFQVGAIPVKSAGAARSATAWPSPGRLLALVWDPAPIGSIPPVRCIGSGAQFTHLDVAALGSSGRRA